MDFWLQPAAFLIQYVCTGAKNLHYHILRTTTLNRAAKCDLPDNNMSFIWETGETKISCPPRVLNQNLLSEIIPK